MSVTRKFDPNEKDMDMDQTSDDPTSATTNYRGKTADGAKVNVTSKGDAERETGRDMLGKDPVTGKSNIQKVSVNKSGIGISRDNETGTTGLQYRGGKDGKGARSVSAKIKDDGAITTTSKNRNTGVTQTSSGTRQWSNPTAGKTGTTGSTGLTGKKRPTAPTMKPAQNNPNPRLASVEGYQADYKEYDWRNPATGKNEKKRVNPRLREDTKVTTALIRKAVESKYPRQVIFEVFDRGMQEHKSAQKAFDRVNSFINRGKAFDLDRDLIGDDR